VPVDAHAAEVLGAQREAIGWRQRRRKRQDDLVDTVLDTGRDHDLRRLHFMDHRGTDDPTTVIGTVVQQHFDPVGHVVGVRVD